MSKIQKIGGILLLLIAVLLTVHCSRQEDGVAPMIEQEQRTATITTPQETHHHEAILTDANNLYRICSSRPQRLLPTLGSNKVRTANPCGFCRVHIVKPIQHLYDSRCRLETAPFSMSASCHYYVIALRHIIR
ncbi:MAG: hypothetical protein IJS97_02795 [Prevotella sp.]|nr:hypothetical protein [Prevotella sp.]